MVGYQGPLRYAEISSGRLADLDAATRGLVEAAALLGADVDAELLGEVSCLPPPVLADAVTGAWASRLLLPVDERLALRHALIRELALAELGIDLDPYRP